MVRYNWGEEIINYSDFPSCQESVQEVAFSIFKKYWSIGSKDAINIQWMFAFVNSAIILYCMFPGPITIMLLLKDLISKKKSIIVAVIGRQTTK